MHASGEGMLNVDCHDLHTYNPELYSKLIKYPSEVITLMDGAVKLVYADIAQTQAENAEVQVRIPRDTTRPACLHAFREL
jgi:DNA replicative helicase MCM subunit Mcm2 (Cdc46/Mcm family)